MTEPMPSADREHLLSLMNDFPLHAMLGFELDRAAEGRATAHVSVGPTVTNVAGVLHGGVLYAVMDVAAFCAAVTVLPADTNAATHDLHVSVLRPSPAGATVALSAEVRKMGKRLMFVDVEAAIDGQVVALARVTKSMIPFVGPPRTGR